MAAESADFPHAFALITCPPLAFLRVTAAVLNVPVVPDFPSGVVGENTGAAPLGELRSPTAPSVAVSHPSKVGFWKASLALTVRFADWPAVSVVGVAAKVRVAAVAGAMEN